MFRFARLTCSAAIALSAVACGPIPGSPSLEPSEEPSSLSARPSTSEASPTVPEAFPPPIIPGLWGTIDLPLNAGEDGGSVRAVADAPGGGLVAVGSAGWNGSVWLSADGITWARVSDVPPIGDEEAAGLGLVGAGPTGLIASGGFGCRFCEAYLSPVWLSETGTTWRETDRVPGFILDIASGGPGLIAVGTNAGLSIFNGPVAWSSPDGETWSLGPTVPGPDSSGMLDLQAWEGGWLAVGAASGAVGQDAGQGLTWRSTDGIVWTTVVPPDPNLENGGLSLVTVDHGALYGAGSVTVDPHQGLSRPAIWVSPTGDSWNNVFLADCCGDFRSFVRDESGFYGLYRWYLPSTGEDGVALVFPQPDGSWQTLGQPELEADVRMTDLVVADGRLFGLGYRELPNSVYLPVLLTPP